MAIEIERKFVVRDDSWRQSEIGSAPIEQAYFARTPQVKCRIRIFGDNAYITLKSAVGGLSRHEFEYKIPEADAVEMIREFSIEPPITKVRYDVPFKGNIWTVDVFGGANDGLVLAEIELESADQAIAFPPWIGEEVTNNPRYENSSLARTPFTTWTKGD
ncbi:CYTH domain-containing protein [Hyphomicrobium facile]|uniref:Adenylate cyclase n=1 Tax=Hyphomicrobium facile TaxID=51670 RepID=A0A1I7NCE3_9HYPH|nr:CYTH domain-containing protein [Hyphomicrobium facile]SFV32340.1 adenylate cyclase [Hyphomicrobium facile]